jgi:hypothetical protein
MSETILLRPREVDAILRYPTGRTLRLARRGLIPCIVLPDGEVRIRQDVVDALLDSGTKGPEHA